MEGLELNPQFWRGRRVLITGHTGFKGSWLSLWMARKGAVVIGYSLPPPTTPSLYRDAAVADAIEEREGDIRDLDSLRIVIGTAQPEIVFHLAAQSLVRASYADAVGTYSTNVLGTVHVLEALRKSSVRVAVIVTSDKCYENREWLWGYRESDPMGGDDPYSSSKGCAELVTAAYRRSFFNGGDDARVATARAGNVIGGGDWAADRLVPDMIRAFVADQPVRIRNPHSVRPWQHVLEPLSAYIALAERLWDDPTFVGGWNFGPREDDVRPVSWIVESVARLWGPRARWEVDGAPAPKEATYLKLDTSKARQRLGTVPRTNIETAVQWTVEWYRDYADQPRAARELVMKDIARLEALPC